MESRNPELPPLPPPPGAISALLNGFNAIASNVAVILIPAVLDLFLWLGPRLKADALFAPILELMPQILAQVSADQADQVKKFGLAVTDYANNFNLFSVFRTFPLGIFSLMITKMSIKSPLGERIGIDIPHWLVAFGIVLILTFCGWLGGSLYFRAVSRVALKLEKAPGVFHSVLHGVLLSGLWLLFFSLVNLPLFVLLWLLSLLDNLVRTILIFLLVVPISWTLLVVFFSFHGIFANAQNAFISFRNSIRMLRYGLPPLGWFAMLTILISQGMDMLWRIPPTDSWMTGIGILGHAFVSTSLLAASFIYYRDLNTWIESALQWLKTQNTTSSARA
jgi:hypothetical protein